MRLDSNVKVFGKVPHAVVPSPSARKSALELVFILFLLSGAAVGIAQEQVLKPRQERMTGIQMVARMSKQPLHIVRSHDNRLFCTLYTAETQRTELVEILKDASIRSFPNEEWNKPRQPNGIGFTEIVGLAIGQNGHYLAILDRGSSTHLPRVVIWDLKADKVLFAREFPKVVAAETDGRLLQDLAIDTKNRCIYAAATTKNRKNGTIIVGDFESGQMRPFNVAAEAEPLSAEEANLRDAEKIKAQARRFYGKDPKPTSTPSTPQDATTITQESSAPAIDSLSLGINIPISVDPDCKWVYFGSPDGKRIFRISTEKLASPQLTQAEFAAAVEDYGTKEYSSHIAADSKGAVYCAEANDTKIGVFTPKRKYRTFVGDKLLDRPYGLAIGRDGYLYISVNQISTFGRGHTPTSTERPYLITRTALTDLE